MPTIPGDAGGRKVLPEISPGPRGSTQAAPRMDPRALAQAVSGPLDLVIGLNEKANQEAVRLEADALDRNLLAAQNQLLAAADQDPDPFTAPEKALEGFDKTYQDASKNHKGDMLRGAAKNLYLDRRSALAQALEKKSADRIQAQDKANFEGRVANINQFTHANAGDLLQVVRQREDLTNIVKDRLAKEGLREDEDRTKDAFAASLREAQSGFWRSAVEGALAGNNPALAKQYLEAAKKSSELDARDEAALGPAFKRQEDLARDGVFRGMVSRVERNPGVDPRTQFTKEEWDGLDLDQRRALYAVGEAPGFTDQQAWGKFLATPKPRLAEMSWEDFRKTYWSRFKEGDRNKAETAWKEAKESGGKTSKTMDGFLTDKQVVDGALLRAGIDPTPKDGTPDADKVYQVRTLVNEKFRAYQDQNGKSPTEKDVQSWVDDLLVKGKVTRKKFFGMYEGESEVRAYEAKAGETLLVDKLDAIPSAARAQIEDTFRRRGVEVTDDKILRVYNTRIQRERGGQAMPQATPAPVPQPAPGPEGIR